MSGTRELRAVSLSRIRKGRYTLSVKPSDFTVRRHTWRKNWVKCAGLTGNSADLRTVLSSPLSHKELRSSLKESHSSLSLPADTTMASSQGTQTSKMNKREATLPFTEACRSLPELWDTENRHYNNRDKKSSGIWHHSHTHKKEHRTDKPDGKPVLCHRTFSSVFRAVFFLHS